MLPDHEMSPAVQLSAGAGGILQEGEEEEEQGNLIRPF